MEIIEQSDCSLHLSYQNPHSIWGLLFAIPFTAAGLGWLALTAKVVTLDCQRLEPGQIECQRTITGILGADIDRIPGKLKTVKKDNNNARGVNRGIVLGTTEGEVELAPYHPFLRGAVDPIANRLNAFIKDPKQTKISVKQDDRWANSIWSLGFLIGGGALALEALVIPKQMSCKLDRNTEEAIVAKKYWLYGDRQRVIPLSAIEGAAVSKLPYRFKGKAVYDIYLERSDGQKLSLSVPNDDLVGYQKIVDVTNDFLHRQRSKFG